MKSYAKQKVICNFACKLFYSLKTRGDICFIMKTDKTYLAYFSPTKTSYKIGHAIATGCNSGNSVSELNATFQPIPAQTNLTSNDLLIVSVPVYGGHVAPLAIERLKNLQGQSTPAVAIVVYGNRNFENAAIELQEFLSERSFNVIAAGAFIGEHSYCTEEYPIAPQRPNTADLDEAKKFGAQIFEKINETAEPIQVHAETLRCPDSGEENLLGFKAFIKEYQSRSQKQNTPTKLIPIVDETLCVSCGQCSQVCPTGAIDENEPTKTDPQKCIKCCACVKSCPENARTLNTPFAPVLSKYFSREKENVYTL